MKVISIGLFNYSIMRGKRFAQSEMREPQRYVMLPIPHAGRLAARWLVMLFFILISNVLTHRIWNPHLFSASSLFSKKIPEVTAKKPVSTLYLIDKAATHILDIDQFENKIKEISRMLRIPPEWLMSVIYHESKFDPSVLNFKGSGAVGLIQFMPTTAAELQVSTERLKRMPAIHQLEYVYLYLQLQRERYGEFTSLTDLYLSILYPKARHQDFCYGLFFKPSKAYKQNSGLDENRDGIITVSDLEKRMKKMFPSAYLIQTDAAM